jgi:hypothetical protein
MSTTASDLKAACDSNNRAELIRVLSSIPRERWTFAPGRADCDLGLIRIQVWHQTGGSGINIHKTSYVQVILDEDRHQNFAEIFTAEELTLPDAVPMSPERTS